MVNQGFDADRSVTPLDREEIAKIEVGQTNVSPRVARALVGWFLLMLASLPFFELVGQAGRSGGTPWSHLHPTAQRHPSTQSPRAGSPRPAA